MNTKSLLFSTIVDIDECDTPEGGQPVCGSHSNCTNTPGSYSCECSEPKEYYSPSGDGKNCIGWYWSCKLTYDMSHMTNVLLIEETTKLSKIVRKVKIDKEVYNSN